MTTNFETLRIYQLSEQLSDEIWQIVTQWNHFAMSTIGKQIVRSADSIGANIAEGSGRGSDVDYRKFLRIARGSLYETKHWIRRAYARHLITDEELRQLQPIMDELLPKLNAYLRSIGNKINPQ